MTVIQRTPNLGLKIRLQPLAGATAATAPAPAPAAGGCEVSEVLWLVRPQYNAEVYEGGQEAWWEVPNLGAYAAVGIDGTGSLIYPDGGAQGPDYVQVRVPTYYEEDGPAQPVTVVGAALGSQTRGVVWSVERAGPVTMRCNIDVSGPLAWCVVAALATSEYTDYLGYEDITLTARCGDAVVGTLRLQLILEGW